MFKNQIVVVVAQHSECAKIHSVVHFKTVLCFVNFTSIKTKKYFTSVKVKHIPFFIVKFSKRELLFLARFYINRPIILKAL